VRIGLGYDSHRLEAGRPLIVGGVHVPFERGLQGHSDADVLIHAIVDAILGAAGLGDIGTHFPDSDERYRECSSLYFLETVCAMVQTEGYKIMSVDAVVIAEAPKFAPYFPQMKNRLAATLQLEEKKVSLKAKTNEGMGWLGRGEGIAALAVALLEDLP
jgi:2-C-methyl-D-erythritol 2,4-cyclodiphosphate synthase